MKEFDRKSRPLRIAVLTNTIPVYRAPVFETLSKDSKFDIRIFLSLPVGMSDDTARQSLTLHHSMGINLRYRTVHSQVSTENVELLHIPVMLLFDLLSFKPDIVISGEFGLRSLVAFVVARFRRAPLIIWSEEIQDHAACVSGLQRRLRSFLIPRASSFLAWGKPAFQYLQSWQIPKEQIHYCAQAVDNEFWNGLSQSYDKEAAREEWGLCGRVFLAVGRLVKRKGFDKLILAWASLPRKIKAENTLVIVGGGSEETALKELARLQGIPNLVFSGMQKPKQLARYYAAADVFVFPSLVDVWGLVVNEAMACGLPVLASKHAGASQELINNTEAGEMFDPNNSEEFTNMLQRWCTQTMSVDPNYIRALVKQHSFSVSIAAIKQMVTEQNKKEVIRSQMQ